MPKALTPTTCAFLFPLPISDTEAPQVTCPRNVQVFTDRGVRTGTAVFDNAVASDNSLGPITISRDKASGSSNFPIGDTVVSFSATDSEGNTNYCSFIVTVIGKSS